MNHRGIVRFARTSLLCVAAPLALLAGCAEEPAADDAPVIEASAPLVDSADVPAEALQAIAHPSECSDELLDRVFTLDHVVRIGKDRRVHITEKFTVRSWLRFPHRGALLLPGTVVKGSFYDLDLDGYRFQSEIAQRGFFTFAIDYEGSGGSSYPADGHSVTQAFLTDEARSVLSAMRLMRLIPKIDVIGESNGGGIAAELCSDATRVRSCTLGSMLWQEGTPFYNAVFLDPNFLAFIDSQPNGYLNVDSSLYFNITARSSPEVTAEILATQPGTYAVAPILAQTTLPWFDPTQARVPGLIIQGTEDDVATQADADALAAAYGSAPGAGGVAQVTRIANAGHVPRVEPAPANDEFTNAVLDFIDP